MNWKTLSRLEASSIANDWNSADSSKFLRIFESWGGKSNDSLNADYKKMREGLLKASVESYGGTDGTRSKGYGADLAFGLKIYELFVKEFGLNAGTASDDGVWRYIQMKVVPDLIFERWSADGGPNRINNDRFWKDSRRMWLKTMWWYIHLSLQNDSLEETERILIGNGSDDISQLVERSGSGYRVELYRAIMRRYFDSERKDRQILRKVLKLNVVRCATVEPLLFSSGIEDYVNSLFEYFGD
jgi:hypothetical protein